EPPGHLDRSPPRDVGSPPGQPHRPDARQARIQRSDEGRGLHPPGAATAVTLARRSAAAAFFVLVAAAIDLSVSAQTLTYRGFFDGRGVGYPQDTARDSTNFVADALAR